MFHVEQLGEAIDIVEFRVLGEPFPEPRAIAGQTFPGKQGKTRAVIRSSAKANPWKVDVRTAALAAVPSHRPRPWFPSGPVVVDVYIRIDRPKSHYGSGRNENRLKASAPTLVSTKPDADNYAKAILDALGDWKGRGPIVWKDDGQVCDLFVRKRYADYDLDLHPGATIRVFRPVIG